MEERYWGEEHAKSPAVFLNGERIRDASFRLGLNAHHEPLDFRPPALDWGRHWLMVLDTVDGCIGEDGGGFHASTELGMETRTVAAFRRGGRAGSQVRDPRRPPWPMTSGQQALLRVFIVMVTSSVVVLFACAQLQRSSAIARPPPKRWRR